MRKPRKPYTITKSREVWTPEEHDRFRNALKLYDRDWKKIEAYIGSKTVLQIRSHAQKHFGKVAKYKTGEYIPPPRPKKRATLPYPRSRSASQAKGSAGTGSDSGIGSDNGHASASQSDTPNGTCGNASGNASGNGSGSDAVPCSAAPAAVHTPNVVRNDAPTTSHHASVRRPWLENEDLPEKDDKALSPGTVPAQANSEAHRKDSSVRSMEPKKDAVESRVGLKSPQRTNGDREMENSRSRLSSPKLNKSRERNVSSPRSKRQVPESRDEGRRSPKRMTVGRNEQNRDVIRHEDGGCSVAETHAANDEIAGLGPNDSLLVLSNCVDMMSRDNKPERPAVGWASAAAARRAHRAKVIRSRKPPLPTHGNGADGEYEGQGESRVVSEVERRSGSDEMENGGEQNGGRMASSGNGTNERDDGRGASPPVSNGGNGVNECIPPDPQRSSFGSGSASDDAIAGFTSSDRPSVSDRGAGSSGASGSGGSLENSDVGDGDVGEMEEPKSSNDGSGDDNNRQSPPTRDSSPADPNSLGNSSGSRENTPNNNTGDGEGNAGDVVGEGNEASGSERGVKRKREAESEGGHGDKSMKGKHSSFPT